MNDAHHTIEASTRRPIRRLALGKALGLAASAMFSLSVAASPALGQGTTGGEGSGGDGSGGQNIQQSTSEQSMGTSEGSGKEGSSVGGQAQSGQSAQSGSRSAGAECKLLEDFDSSPMQDSFGDDLSKEIYDFHQCVGDSAGASGSGSGEPGSGEAGSGEAGSSGETAQDNASDQYSQNEGSGNESSAGENDSTGEPGLPEDSSDSSAGSQYDDEGAPSGTAGGMEGSSEDGSSNGPGDGPGEDSSENSGASENGESHDATATVERAKDGDTLALQEPVEGHDTVRLIGVDSPELNSSEEGEEPEPYAEEAKDFTTEELEGEEVSLEFGQEQTDDYDRLLAYVYTDHENGSAEDSSSGDEDNGSSDSSTGSQYDDEGGDRNGSSENGSSEDGSSENGESSTTSEDEYEMFNETLLEEGYGEVLTIEPNSRYEDLFEEAESAARDEGKGIWSEDGPGGNSSGEDASGASEDSSDSSADGGPDGSTSSGQSTSGIATSEGEDSPDQGKGDTDSGGDENTLTGLVIFWD